LLWFCWYGFNPGSTLSAMDASGIARVAANTTLAACAAGMTALLYAHARTGVWSVSDTTNGVLAGLVAVTCPCYWVSPLGAIAIGAGGALAMCGATEALEHFRVDDPVGAVPVHLAAGVWGTMSLGLFATGEFGLPTANGPDVTGTVSGLFYGGGAGQLVAQATGSAAIVIATLMMSFALMYGLHLIGVLRISEHGERIGLDRHEHGAVAHTDLESPAAQPLPRPADARAATATLPRVRAAR
jgi:ammonium transporter, Amt family